MGTLDRKLGSKKGQYTRIEILKPGLVDDGYNTTTGTPERVRTNIAAYFSEPANIDDESLKGNLIRSRLILEFEVRYPFGIDVKPTWKLKDLFENRDFEVISSPVTVGRRQFVRFKAALIE